MLTLSEQEYVETLIAGLDAYPAYYAHMGPANAAGPASADLSAPAHADAAELLRRIEAGEWLVNLRTRTAFAAAGRLAGTLSFPLDGSFTTSLGWLIPWGTPLSLSVETPQQVADAQRELVRIGIDRPASAATGGPDGMGRRPAPEKLPGRGLRRPGRGPPPPPGHPARCAPEPGMGRVAHRRGYAHSRP